MITKENTLKEFEPANPKTIRTTVDSVGDASQGNTTSETCGFTGVSNPQPSGSHFPEGVEQRKERFLDVYGRNWQQLLLAHMLRHPDFLSETLNSQVDEGDFGNPLHVGIFTAARSLVRARGGDPAVPVSKQALKAHLALLGGFMKEEERNLKDEVEDIYEVQLDPGYCRAQLADFLRQTRLRRMLHQIPTDAVLDFDAIMHRLEQIDRDTGDRAMSVSVRRVSEIRNMELSELTPIIPGYLAPGDALAIIGAPGIGKSGFVRQLALDVILGNDFLGFGSAGQHTKWLILQMEDGLARLKHELNSMLGHFHDAEGRQALQRLDSQLFIHTLENDLDGYLQIGGESKKGRKFDQSGSRRIASVIAKVQPDVVVFDPLAHFAQGDLNDDSVMFDLCREAIRLTKEGNPRRIPILVHHGRTGREAAAGAVGWDRASFGRNSKALYGIVRAQINIAPAAGENNDTLVVASGKANNSAGFETFAVTRNSQTMRYHRDETFDLQRWTREVSGPRQNTGLGDIEDFFNLVPETGDIAKTVLCRQLAPQAARKIGMNKAESFLNVLVEQRRLHLTKRWRSGTGPEVRVTKRAPEPEVKAVKQFAPVLPEPWVPDPL